MPKLRCQLRQGLQHKPAFHHSRMRNLQIGQGDDGFAKEHNVDVDAARALRDGPFAAHVTLDFLQARKQLAREQCALGFDDLVQKPRLAGNIARSRFINTGLSQNANTRVAQTIAGACQIFQAIA